MAIRECNIGSDSICTELVLYSKNEGVVRGIFDLKNKISNYKIPNEIYACEVLTTEGRKFIENKFTGEPNLID